MPATISATHARCPQSGIDSRRFGAKPMRTFIFTLAFVFGSLSAASLSIADTQRACRFACVDQNRDQRKACDESYENSNLCLACGGMIQPITGSCLPGDGPKPGVYWDPRSNQIIVIRPLYECLAHFYGLCLDQAVTNLGNCITGCNRPEIQFPHPIAGSPETLRLE